MLAMRTILVPTDFSHHSEFAFHLAAALARDHGAELVVLHVAAPAVAVIYGEGMLAQPPEGYKKELQEKLEKLKPVEPSISVRHVLAEGDPVTETVRVAKETAADLIVMGTHGWKGLARMLMGSVAEGVMRRAPCPVLTSKSNDTSTPTEVRPEQVVDPQG